MRKWSCTRRMVEIKCCGTIRRLRCFFSSSRVGSATHRHYWKTQDRASQHKEEMPDRPAWKLSIPFELPARWMRWKRRGKRRGGTGERRGRERERKKESSVHTHTRTHVHTEQCTLRDLGNGKWERGEEIMISKRYRVPYVPKDYPLNLGLISGKKKRKKTRWYELSRW